MLFFWDKFQFWLNVKAHYLPPQNLSKFWVISDLPLFQFDVESFTTAFFLLEIFFKWFFFLNNFCYHCSEFFFSFFFNIPFFFSLFVIVCSKQVKAKQLLICCWNNVVSVLHLFLRLSSSSFLSSYSDLIFFIFSKAGKKYSIKHL